MMAIQDFEESDAFDDESMRKGIEKRTGTR